MRERRGAEEPQGVHGSQQPAGPHHEVPGVLRRTVDSVETIANGGEIPQVVLHRAVQLLFGRIVRRALDHASVVILKVLQIRGVVAIRRTLFRRHHVAAAEALGHLDLGRHRP